MRSDFVPHLKAVRTRGWKKVKIDFTGGPLRISVPADCVELQMKKAAILRNPAREIEEAIHKPCAGPTLEEIIQSKAKPAKELTVAITVSDITRPVPYRGKSGILPPLLKALQDQGIEKKNIAIIVGTGTHRASTAAEKIEMLGQKVAQSYKVLDHDAEDRDSLICLGKTATGTEVFLNRNYCAADVKIATGLTESHFMAGVSGGRKAICPGLADLRTIQRFHSPEFLEAPQATNLVLAGNPCHEESLAVARAAGVDFTITVTLDHKMRITGVFAGDLDIVLEEAVKKIRSYVEIPVQEEFDIVLTHGVYVGRNHYQMAKAAVGALPAVRFQGVIILAADNRDPEPIGGPEYKTLIHLLKLQGPDGYVDLLRCPGWKFTKDQWEPEVWARTLRKVGEEGLIYCTADISEKMFSLLPGVSGYAFLSREGRRKTRARKVQEMVQNAVIYFYGAGIKGGVAPRMAFIQEGPYAVPVKI
jgi:nickel-dependent lactate racemase